MLDFAVPLNVEEYLDRKVKRLIQKRASGGTADALASGASVRKGVGVQIPPRARLVRKKIPGRTIGSTGDLFVFWDSPYTDLLDIGVIENPLAVQSGR